MEKGTLVRWNAEKGFGFIKPETANSKDMFIHISILKKMARKPVVGDQINYLVRVAERRQDQSDKSQYRRCSRYHRQAKQPP